MSVSPFVSVAEVRQRLASAVEALDGFKEVPWPLSVDGAPAGYDTHPFAILIAETSNTGLYRDNVSTGIRVRSICTVQFLSVVKPAEGEELSSLDIATNAEAKVIRALLTRGPAWSLGLQVGFSSSSRGVAEDGGFLVVDVVVTVDHVLALS